MNIVVEQYNTNGKNDMFCHCKLCYQLISLNLSINSYLKKMLLIKINIYTFTVDFLILLNRINVTCQFTPV